MKRFVYLSTLIACAAMFLGATAAKAVTVNNHSFESPGFNGAYPPITATGWFSAGGNNYIDNGVGHVTDGAVYQQLGSDISQNTGVAVTPGALYLLEFSWSSFGASPGALPTVGLFANPNAANDGLDAGNTTLLSANPPVGNLAGLSQAYLTTTPAPASGFLYIQFTSGINFRGVDNVRLTLIPEPASVVLTGMALLGGVCLTRRRRRA